MRSVTISDGFVERRLRNETRWNAKWNDRAEAEGKERRAVRANVYGRGGGWSAVRIDKRDEGGRRRARRNGARKKRVVGNGAGRGECRAGRYGREKGGFSVFSDCRASPSQFPPDSRFVRTVLFLATF